MPASPVSRISWFCTWKQTRDCIRARGNRDNTVKPLVKEDKKTVILPNRFIKNNKGGV
jgi:hypothetical protein